MVGTATAAAINARYVTMVAAGAACGGFLFGFDTSTMNGAIIGIRATLGLDAGTVGFVTAIALIGAALGAWFAGPLSARMGRKRVMLSAGILITAGSLGAALSSQVVLTGLFRLVTGLGIGAASAVVPPYISEIAPPSIRGRLGSLWQFAIVFGQFLGLLAGYGLTQWAGSEAGPLPWGGAAWRWMFVVVALLAVAYIVIARELPQSPQDLVRHGHENQARALLARIGGASAEEQAAAIRRAQTGHSEVATLRDLRGSRFGLQGIVWTGTVLAAFQQLVGINVVKTYSNTLWQAVGFSTGASFTISIITVLVSIASTVVAIALIDKVGRRAMLGSGAVVMVLALGTLAVCFSSATGSGDDVSLGRAAGITALVAINVFAVGFGVTWGPVMWVMLSELFDSNLRTTAVAVCTALNWITNWAVTRTFPLLASVGLAFAYGLYTVFAVLAFIFVLKVLPETRGRSLS
jgi:MFS transporter, SP family, sugar:H+ symporter